MRPFAPAAFVQYLKQESRKIARRSPILVVEGAGDRRALMGILAADVHVVAAGGREQVLAASRDAELIAHPNICFILDCDGAPVDELKGLPHLTLTTNRDIESDVVFELDGFARVGLDLLIGHDHTERPQDVLQRVGELLEDAATTATYFGCLLQCASSIGLRCKVVDPTTNVRRRAILSDLDRSLSDLGSPIEIANATAALLGWTMEEQSLVESEARRLLNDVCVTHQRVCALCARRLYCGGHLLVDALVTRCAKSGVATDRLTIERGIRTGLDLQRLGDWRVAQRLESWTLGTGFGLLNERFQRASPAEGARREAVAKP